MSSDLTTVLRNTLGLFVNEPCGKTAEKLKLGDVTDQQFGHSAVFEVENIKAKLEAIANKGLATSISLLTEGLILLCQLLTVADSDTVKIGSTVEAEDDEDDDYDYIDPGEGEQENEEATQAQYGQTVSPAHQPNAEGTASQRLLELDQSASYLLHNAKEKITTAKEEAITALGHETFDTCDYILFSKIQIATAMLENITSPCHALEACKLALEQLHEIPVVRQVFSDEFLEVLKSEISDEERAHIIASVCHLNHVIFNVTLAFGAGQVDILSAYVDTGEEHVHPLLDARSVRMLHKRELGHLDVTWSFGQRGKRPAHKLVEPWDVTTNTQGHFIVADWGGDNVKVYNNSGMFLHSLCPLGANEPFSPCSVATDPDDNVYVLAAADSEDEVQWQGVYVFGRDGKFRHKFSLPGRDEFEGWSLTVTTSTDSEVVVLGECAGTYRFDVYKTNGDFVQSFNEAIVGNASHITSAHDGRVMVADSKYDRVCILQFDSWGVHLTNFKVNGFPKGAIAFNSATKHIIVTSSPHSACVVQAQVEVYATDGTLIHTIALDTGSAELGGATVTFDGRIAIVNETECKIQVI